MLWIVFIPAGRVSHLIFIYLLNSYFIYVRFYLLLYGSRKLPIVTLGLQASYRDLLHLLGRIKGSEERTRLGPD